MNTTDKLVYEIPSIVVVEVSMEHFLCESGVEANRHSYGTASQAAGTEQEWD